MMLLEEIMEVKALIGRFETAVNQCNVTEVSECFTEDADFTNPLGKTVQGRKAIADLHSPLFNAVRTPGVPSFYKAVLVTEELKIRFIKPDIAAIAISWSQTGVIAPDGSSLPLRKGIITAIAQKSADQWSIAVFHNMELK